MQFINDQTLRLANLGYKPVEIAEQLDKLKLPPALDNDWDIRGYYGSLNHNVKSVYVKHIGWFNGNPAMLHSYPPCEAGKKYVEFMGGPQALLEKAMKSYADGDYRWVAEVMNYLIFAKPRYPELFYIEAKKLQADAFEQLGYQAESGPWRNFYLTGAKELRNGVDIRPSGDFSKTFLCSCPLDIFFDYMGMLLKGHEVSSKTAVIDVIITDPNNDEKYQLTMENGVLNHTDLIQYSDYKADNPDVTVKASRDNFYQLIGTIAKSGYSDKLLSDFNIDVEGDTEKFEIILKHLQKLNPHFNVIEPVDSDCV